MPFEWFVALRYLREGRAQTALILAAVSVGVGVIVFLSALINGLQASLIKQTLGTQPHITLEPHELLARPLFPAGTVAATTIEKAPQRLLSINQWPTVLEQVERVPGVLAASHMVTGTASATRGVAEKPVLVRGVDPERFLSVIDVRSKMKAGRFQVSGDGVVIGTGLAELLGVVVGDKLRLSTALGADALVVVRGTFELGNRQVDERWLISSLRVAQTLFDLPGGVSTLELKVADVFGAETIARDLAERTGLESSSWMRVNAQLLVGLRSQELQAHDSVLRGGRGGAGHRQRADRVRGAEVARDRHLARGGHLLRARTARVFDSGRCAWPDRLAARLRAGRALRPLLRDARDQS